MLSLPASPLPLSSATATTSLRLFSIAVTTDLIHWDNSQTVEQGGQKYVDPRRQKKSKTMQPMADIEEDREHTGTSLEGGPKIKTLNAAMKDNLGDQNLMVSCI